MSITPAMYIVRMHDRRKPWVLPKYYATHSKNWLDGAFHHADAAILWHEEASQVVAKFPGSVMLRVG
jgi:hypothetical protein